MPSEKIEGIQRNSTFPAVKIHRSERPIYFVVVGPSICRSDVATHCTSAGAGPNPSVTKNLARPEDAEVPNRRILKGKPGEILHEKLLSQSLFAPVSLEKMNEHPNHKKETKDKT